MATLNLSTNGPAITASYQRIVNAPAPSGPAASSPTYGQWAVFTVQAPLASAFQQESGKESVLKVQTTGEGELVDLIEDFSDGRIQFAFLKIKDPNTSLPKSVLIGWCGEGVPERTKGYFTSHLNAVARVLSGYHVQITARSDRDLTPESIVRKVADASGSKYSGGGSVPSSGLPPPPVASKPILPTKSFGNAGGFQPLNSRSRAPAPAGATDSDGWGTDAPQVTRSQLEKVESAYRPTKVDMAQLTSQHQPSNYQAPAQSSNGADVVRGGYQPIGKVDIAAIRAQAQEQGKLQDDRPSVIKGAYEPIGKVDISEIRRKAQAAPPPVAQPTASDDNDAPPRSLAERSSAFTNAERLTSMPKPKVENRFGSANTFSGTKAPSPGGFTAKPLAAAAPVGTASKTFADQGGKTPAQQWAERKARERGISGGADSQPSAGFGSPAQPVQPQVSEGWQSGYAGKKWGVNLPSRTGGSATAEQEVQEDEPAESTDIGSIRDRFNEPPPLDTASKPNAAPRAVPVPGLPTRPQADVPAVQHQDLPPPPPRPQPADEEEEDDDIPQGQGSPIQIAMPVAREPEPKPLVPATEEEAPPMPTRSLARAATEAEPEPEPQSYEEDPARGAAQAVAESNFGAVDGHNAGAAAQGGREAVAQYDYEKAEDNELELHEGERVINIDMVDEDWWMGENERGEKGLFPSNYVELQPEASASVPAIRAVPPPAPVAETAPPAGPTGGAKGLPTATALYDYEAAEDNELSFAEGAQIEDVEFPDDDWWSGRVGNNVGLFPSNYVQLDE